MENSTEEFPQGTAGTADIFKGKDRVHSDGGTPRRIQQVSQKIEAATVSVPGRSHNHKQAAFCRSMWETFSWLFFFPCQCCWPAEGHRSVNLPYMVKLSCKAFLSLWSGKTFSTQRPCSISGTWWPQWLPVLLSFLFTTFQICQSAVGCKTEP